MTGGVCIRWIRMVEHILIDGINGACIMMEAGHPGNGFVVKSPEVKTFLTRKSSAAEGKEQEQRPSNGIHLETHVYSLVHGDVVYDWPTR